MSTKKRRQSHHSIEKSARHRSKSKHHPKHKRYSANTIRSNSHHSHTQQPHRYSQPPSTYINHNAYSLNNGYNDNNDNNDNNDDNLEDSPPAISAISATTSTRPTHKKSAVSSFLSIFSTFSQSKVRRTNSNTNDNIDNMTDLEILKRMKRRILDILSKMLDSKKLKKVKSELKSEVWEIEYSELKKRLSTHDIHTATIRQKFSTVKSLKQLSSLHTNHDGEDGEDDDVREMATFLLQEYFDQPTTTNTNNHSQPKQEQQQTVIAANTIKESQTDIDDIDDDDDDDDKSDDDDFYSDHSQSFSDHNDDEDDEKKIKIDSNNNNNNISTPFEDEAVDENKERDFKYDHKNDNDKHVKYGKHKKHKKISNKHKKRKYKKRRNMDGYTSDGIITPTSNNRRISKSHKYSPRPISPRPKPLYNNNNNNNNISFDIITDKNNNNNNNHDDDILNININNNNNNDVIDDEKRRKSKQHRIEIRNKFRRGVRKAMLVNAWSGITPETDNNNNNNDNSKRLSLSLSTDNNDGIMNIISSSSNVIDSKSPSYSLPFSRFMSDNLMLALSKVGTWEFDPFEFFDTPEIGGKGLVYSVWYLFDKYDVFKLFPSISPKKFMKFLVFVENGYLDNPYHNKIHATDVVSNVAYYLNTTQFFAKHVSLFDKFTAILSAAVHDLGHDGNNNQYHITTMSDLAVIYNDISVLENYHIAETFRILKKPECAWYNQLNKKIQRYLRLAMIDIVLATDMKYHNQKLAQLTGLVAILKQQLNKKILLRDDRDSIASTHSTPLSPMNIRKGSQSSLIDSDREHHKDSIDSTPIKQHHLLLCDSTYNIKPKTLSDFPLYKYKVDEIGMNQLLSTAISDIIITDNDPRVIDVNDERRFILCWLVHLCDISNCAKSLKSGKKWAVRVMTEFFKQGDRERASGLEVSAMMDRRRSSTPSGQVGFIKFILRPSYNIFVRLVPEASKPLEILNENLEYWEIQQKLMTQQRKKRAKSLGSINQNPALLLIQDQLKQLNINIKGGDIEEDDDANSQKSVEIKDVNDSDIKSEIQQTKSSNNKHVGFKDTLIIENDKKKNKNDYDSNHSMDIDNESVITIITNNTPRTLSNRSINFGHHTQYTQLTQSTSNHTVQQSSSSGHSSRRSQNLTIDSMDGTVGTPLSGKLRAHSIHVSIPTSEKQIQSQPIPFSEFLAELRKEWEQKEDEKYEKEQQQNKLKKRRDKTNKMKQIMHKSDGLIQLQTKKIIKVHQSKPTDDIDDVGAQITISDDNNNNNNNKQVFDVV